MKYNLQSQMVTKENASTSIVSCARRLCPNSAPSTPDSRPVSLDNIAGYDVASWAPGTRTAIIRRSARRTYTAEDYPYSGSFQQTFCQAIAPVYDEVISFYFR